MMVAQKEKTRRRWPLRSLKLESLFKISRSILRLQIRVSIKKILDN